MDLFGKVFSKNPPSKSIAKERLKFILIQDRVNLSPQYLEFIKNDIIKVISDYAEVDEEGIEVRFAQDGEENIHEPALIANIPIKRIKELIR